MNTAAKGVQAGYIYSQKSPEKAKEYVATNLKGYSIHDGLSDNHSIVLHNPETNHSMIAYRGTLNDIHHPILSLQDWAADAQVALGLHHIMTLPIEASADMKYQRVKASYPEANISTAGHSLGGVESYYVATKNNLQGHHFNIGESPLGGGTLNATAAFFHKEDPRYTQQHIYHADNYKALGNIYHGSDPISEGSKGLAGTHHVIKVNAKTDLDAHNLKHFITNENKKVPVANITFSAGKSPSLSAESFEDFIKRKSKKKNITKK